MFFQAGGIKTWMITCNNCGRVNDESTRICRFCGKVFERHQPSAQRVRDYTPPATGVSGAAHSQQFVEPYSPPGAATGGYRCPNCQSTYPPIAEKRISTEGWIVFVALLVFCLPLFWVGLLMKEQLRVCPVCRARVG
jgi:RNA polymerase subunit RPABC4/transcription elongation factor Spt4